jgi:hypothetical protein
MDEERVLLKALEEIRRNGWFNRNVPWELFEVEAEIRDWDDYERLLHEDIPSEIREVCKKIRATASIYHLKDDVNLPEYIVLIKRGRGKCTLMLGLSDETCYDDGEEEPIYYYTVLIVDGVKGWVEVPVYYHPI